MHRRQRIDNTNVVRDLEEQWDSMTSRLKRNFRSTSCSGQSFPGFRYQLCKDNLLWELQELILTHLPALKLVELKAVCRSWRDLLQSSRFKEKWQLMRGGCGNEALDVWVMKSDQEDLIAYVPALDKYFLFLSLICSSLVMTQPSFTFKINEVSFLCACGSKIILANKDWRSRPCFFMYDPHNGQRMNIKELQLQTDHELYFISSSTLPVLVLNTDQRCFCLTVEVQNLSENGSHPLYGLCAYKYTTANWTYHSKSSARQADISDKSAVLSGDLYQYDQEDSTLYVWSVQQWIKVQVAWPLPDTINGGTPTDAKVLKVVRCKEHVLLITATVQQEEGVATQCLSIWKLMKEAEESETWNWLEISRTPPELCLKSFNQWSFSHSNSMCDGRRICIMVPSQEFFPALVYDVEHDRWYQLHGALKNTEALFAMDLVVKIESL